VFSVYLLIHINFNPDRLFYIVQTEKWTRYKAILVTNQVTDLGRVRLEKLIVTHLVKKFPASYRNRGSLLCPRQPATGPYPEPEESNQRHPTPFPSRSILIFPSIPRSSEWSLTTKFSNQSTVDISHLSHACYTYRPSHSPWRVFNNCKDLSNHTWTAYFMLIQVV
jgi:hypothetical protein